jgi:hypothetical protein
MAVRGKPRMGSVSVEKSIAWAHGLRTRHIEIFSRGDLFFGG